MTPIGAGAQVLKLAFRAKSFDSSQQGKHDGVKFVALYIGPIDRKLSKKNVRVEVFDSSNL